MASRTIDGRGDTRGYARVEEGAKKEVSGTIGNRGRFAAIALPRSYRPELQQTPSCLSHIYLHTYMHTYLWLVPSCIRAYVHTCIRAHVGATARFPPGFPLLFFSPSFSLLYYRAYSSLSFGFRYTTEASVSLQFRLESTHNTTPISTRAGWQRTRAGIRYTSDFLSVKLVSCGLPRNLRFRRCRMIFTWLVKMSRTWDSLSHLSMKNPILRCGKIVLVSANYRRQKHIRQRSDIFSVIKSRGICT